MLAYDVDPRTGNVVLVDPERVRAVAYRRLLEGIRQSKMLRESLLKETDDDHEWIPNPRQRDTAFPLAMDAQTFATWGTLLDEIQRLVQGKSLLGGHVDGAPNLAQSFLLAGLCKPGQGIDVHDLFMRPLEHPLDSQEAASRCVAATPAKPFSGLAALASATIRRNAGKGASGADSGEWVILRHLYWVN